MADESQWEGSATSRASCSADRARFRTWCRVSRRSDESRADASRVRGSGSSAFPAPSLTLTVAGRVFEVFPCAPGRPKAVPVLPRFGPPSLADPPRHRGLRGRERPADHPNPLRSLLAPHAGAANLAGPHECRPSVSFIRRLRRVSSSGSPPSCSVSAVHSQRPVETGHLRPSGAIRPGPVPPSWFLATSTVSSSRTVRALLQPAADPGVHRVSQPAKAFPTMRSPLEDAPRPQRLLPHHPIRRWGVHGRLSLQSGLLPPRTVSGDRRRSPSMGFCSPSDHRIPLAADGGPRSSMQPELRILERFTSKNGTEVPSPR